MRKSSVVWIFAAAVALCLSAGAASREIICEGEYGGHVQGVATDGQSVYWSFTVEVVRTDLTGKRLASTGSVPRHQGDLCVKDGIVYVAVNRGRFNQMDAGKSEIHAYDAATMKLLRTWPLPDMPHGAGGMTYAGDRFFVIGGLPATIEENYVYEYDGDFRLVKRHALATGFTLMGIQTAAFEDGRFVFGFYGGKGNPAGVFVCPRDLSSFARRTAKGAEGLLKLDGEYWTAHTIENTESKTCGGKLVLRPKYPESSPVYAAQATGKGELRVFFGNAATNERTDCGYELKADGYRPLTQFNGAFVPTKDAANRATVPAVELATDRNYSAPDLVRGVRRAAECDEMLAVHFPAKAELKGDVKLEAAYDAALRECKSLGVRVMVRETEEK